jgi:hypothetical protein
MAAKKTEPKIIRLVRETKDSRTLGFKPPPRPQTSTGSGASGTGGGASKGGSSGKR